MQDLERLDVVLKDLEDNSKELANMTAVYKKIAEIGDNLSSLADRITDNESALKELADELRNEQSRLSKICGDFAEEQRDKLEKYDSQMSSRLERFVSDLVVEIRRGNDQTEKGLEVAIRQASSQLEEKFTVALSAVRRKGLIWSIAVISVNLVALALLLFFLLR